MSLDALPLDKDSVFVIVESQPVDIIMYKAAMNLVKMTLELEEEDLPGPEMLSKISVELEQDR